MKKILYITAFVPGRTAAGENHTRQLINSLAKENYVDLIYFKYKKNNYYNIESSNVNVIKVFNNSIFIKVLNFLMLPCLFPLFTVRFNLFRLYVIRKIIRNNNYSLVFLDYSQTFIYGKFINTTPLLLNSHDIITQRYSRIKKGLFVSFCRFTENIMLHNKHATIFVHNEKDKFLLKRWFRINGYVTDVMLESTVIETNPTKNENYFVFFANWSRADNYNGLHWFLKNVNPLLKESINIKIIGIGLDKKIVTLVNMLSNITYYGFVDNPYPLISNATALISPLFSGAGIKVKALESLACGTPVIGTEITFEGIPSAYSQFMYRADSANEFINTINKFSISLKGKKEIKDLFINSYNNNLIIKKIKECQL